MASFSRAHYRLVSPQAVSSPEEIARHRAACEQARSETKAKFPKLTADNAAEAIAFQEKRIQEILSQ